MIADLGDQRGDAINRANAAGSPRSCDIGLSSHEAVPGL